MKPLNFVLIEASLMPQVIIGKIYFESFTADITTYPSMIRVQTLGPILKAGVKTFVGYYPQDLPASA